MSSPLHRLRLDSVALLTAIPAMLGFIPERSIIVVAIGVDRRVRATMRHDLALDERGRPADILLRIFRELGAICRDFDTVGVVMVIVDDRYGTGDTRYRRLMALADHEFADAGGVHMGFVLNEFVCGAPWLLAWRQTATAKAPLAPPTAYVGVLDDPRTCPAAVANVVTTGRRLLSHRWEMQRMLDPEPRCAHPSGCSPETPAPVGAPEATPGECGKLLELLVESAAVPELSLDCQTLDRVERGITVLSVRDAALALAVTDLRDGAEQRWRELTRRFRGRARASAATLLAHLHYIGGEGGYAGVALDTALVADPGW